MNGRKPASRAKKEAFFVQVPTSDNSVAYFNVTEHLGKAMPFEKPKATCAMRVTAESISFSLLHLTKKAATTVAGQSLQMPRGPLAKLERRAATFTDLADDEVAVEHGRDEEGKAIVHKLKIERDENGIAHLSSIDDEVNFELPKGAVGLSIYMRSPAVKRIMGVGFIGHIGKPGDPTSLSRAVSMALFSLSQLTEFKILSGIETVNVPAPPSKWGTARRAVQRQEKAAAMVPTRFFSGDPQPAPVGAGHVGVEVDLENANPNSGRLLFHYTPDKDLEAAWPSFRPLYDSTISALVTSHLGADEVADITYEIVLGAVEAGTVERLKEALEAIKGLDCTPTQYRLHA